MIDDIEFLLERAEELQTQINMVTNTHGGVHAEADTYVFSAYLYMNYVLDKLLYAVDLLKAKA